MTSREIRWHRSALSAHAIAAAFYATTNRADLMTAHVFQAAMLLGHGGGAWGGPAS